MPTFMILRYPIIAIVAGNLEWHICANTDRAILIWGLPLISFLFLGIGIEGFLYFQNYPGGSIEFQMYLDQALGALFCLAATVTIRMVHWMSE